MNTMQFEFDAVVTHLFTQGKPAVEDNITGRKCVYRAGELSCAVGCRIPDEVYEPGMDVPVGGHGTGVTSLVKFYGKVLPPEISEYQSMFTSLQNVHDDASIVKDGKFITAELESWLRSVAEDYKLQYNGPVA